MPLCSQAHQHPGDLGMDGLGASRDGHRVAVDRDSSPRPIRSLFRGIALNFLPQHMHGEPVQISAGFLASRPICIDPFQDPLDRVRTEEPLVPSRQHAGHPKRPVRVRRGQPFAGLFRRWRRALRRVGQSANRHQHRNCGQARRYAASSVYAQRMIRPAANCAPHAFARMMTETRRSTPAARPASASGPASPISRSKSSL